MSRILRRVAATAALTLGLGLGGGVYYHAAPSAFAATHSVPQVAAPAGSVFSIEQAGFRVTGRDFATVRQTVFLPNAATFAPELQGFGLSVQLWQRSQVITLGISNSTTAGNYCPAISVVSTAVGHAQMPASATPNTFTCKYAPGQTVTLTASFNRTTGTVNFMVDNGVSAIETGSFSDPSARLSSTDPITQARVGAEFGCTPFTSCSPPAPVPYNAPARDVRLAIISNASFTTYNGNNGVITSFAHAPVTWTRNGAGNGAVNATANYLTGGNHFGVYLQP